MATRKMLGRMAAGAVVVGLLIAAGPAGAHHSSYPTQIQITDIDNVGTETGIVYGWVDSSRARCVHNRKIKVKVAYSDQPPLLFDIARSGNNGGWLARGPLAALNGAKRIKAKAVKKRFGHHKRHVCKAAAMKVVPLSA